MATVDMSSTCRMMKPLLSGVCLEYPVTLMSLWLERKDMQSHCDFRVRKSQVLSALQWLQVNNVYYHNLTIDHDSLALLPEDGDISGLTSVTFECISGETSQDPSSTADEDLYDAHLATTFVPIFRSQRTEQETIRQSVQKRQSDHLPTVPPTVMWPAAGATSINEFNTEGYTGKTHRTDGFPQVRTLPKQTANNTVVNGIPRRRAPLLWPSCGRVATRTPSALRRIGCVNTDPRIRTVASTAL